jgi:hypothetical protein
MMSVMAAANHQSVWIPAKARTAAGKGLSEYGIFYAATIVAVLLERLIGGI